MSLCGIKNLYINGVDYKSTFQSIKWSETTEGANGIISFDTDITSTTSFTYNSPVLIYDDDNNLIFWGVARTDAPTYDTLSGKKTYNIRIIDYKVHYNDTTVLQYFPNVTLKSALETMFNRYYPGDNILSIYDNGDYIYNISFQGMGFTQVINELIKFSSEELYWKITYNTSTSKIEHTIGQAYTNKLTTTLGNTTDVNIDTLAPFTEDLNAIKNTITITATQLTSKNRYPQEYFFYNENVGGDVFNNAKYMIACDFKPTNIQAFLMLGKHEGDYAKVMNCSLIELPVEIVEDGKSQLEFVDIAAHMKNFQYVKSLNQIQGVQLVGNTKIEYDAGVLLSKKYSDKFRIRYDKTPQADHPETEFGTFSVYSQNYIKNNLWAIQETLGRSIDYNDVIGYMFKYNTNYDCTETFEDSTSVGTYGNLRAEPINRYFPDYSTFKSFGELWVKVNSQVTKQGLVKFPIYLNGVEKFTERPVVNDVIDIDLPIYNETYNDVKILAVDYEFEGSFGYCSISTQAYKNNKIKKLIDALNKLDIQIKHSKDTPTNITDCINIPISLTFTINSITCNLIDDNDCYVDNTKTWEEVYLI